MPRPSARSCAEQRGERAPSRGGAGRRPARRAAAPSGCAGERARDLDDALLAERQRRRRRVGVGAEAAALDLAPRLGEQRGLLGAVEPQHRRQPAAAAAQVRAEGDVVEHAARAEQPHMLEGAAEAAARRSRATAGRPSTGPAAAPRRRSASSDARDHVEEGALAGAVRADQRMDLAGLHVERDARRWRPARRSACVTSRASSSTLPAGGGSRRGSGVRGMRAGAAGASAPQPAAGQARQRRPDAVGEALQHDHHQQAEHDHLEIAAAAEQPRQHSPAAAP